MGGLIADDLSVTSLLLWVVLALAGYFLLSWIFRKTKNLPPGPREWGTTWKILKASMNGSFHELAEEWAKTYGPLCYVNCLGRPMVFLNTSDVTRRILASDEYKIVVGGRIPTAAPTIGMYNRKDLIFTEYDAICKKKRRMFFQVIGLYGDGVEKFEGVVQGEMARLFKEIGQHENEDYELWKPLCRSLKIIIYILSLGEVPPDPDMPDILEEYDIAFNKLWEPEFDYPLTMFPFLAKIPGKFKNAVDRVLKAQKAAEDLVYYNPEKTHVPGRSRGIADLLFDFRNKPGNEFMKEDPVHVISFLMTLFFGAHLTSRSTLLSSMLCLVNYPKVAKRIQEEIDNVIGNEKPRIEDRANMPYTEAFILEVLRLVTQIPLSGMRHAGADIQIDGMTIPKGSVLVTNTWFFHHDEKIFEDPWTLKPERFLTSSGQILPADDPVRKSILPFGIGARSCPGEVFARSRVFMFVTSILQKYDLLPPANEKLVSADFRSNHDNVKGFIRQCQPYKCRLHPRNKVIK